MLHINNITSSGIAGAVRGLTAPYAYAGMVGVLLVLISLGGCGLKGDLYLPEKQSPVVITPAADVAASSSSSSSSSSSQAAP